MRNSITRTVIRLSIILLSIIVILAAPAYFIFRNAQETIVRELGKNAVNIAATISEFTENNIEKYLKIPMTSYAQFDNTGSFNPDDTSAVGLPQNGVAPGAGAASTDSAPDADFTSFHKELTGIFGTLMETTDAQNIYIVKKMPEMQKAFLFKEDFEQRTRYDASVLLSDDEVRVFEKGIADSSDLLRDDIIGAYISGFAPIKDHQDNVVGIVAVEFSLAYAKDITIGIRNIVIFCFTAIALLATVAGNLLIVSRQKYLIKDYLTALCNKSYFERKLRSSVRLARAKKRPLSLILFDIDYFKNLNDTYGHQIGDTILKAVSETVLSLTRNSDICARYGGDEFVVLLTDTDKTQASFVAERIKDEVAHLTFPSNDSLISVTLSIGVASLDPNMVAETLVRYADQAMYASKNSGKNMVIVHQPTPYANAAALESQN